jgi:hypothetical protein
MISRTCTVIVTILLAAFCAPTFAADPQAKLFDAHLHYNADARRQMSPEKTLSRLEAAGIGAVIATSTPNEGSTDLGRAAEGRSVAVIAFLRPYHSDADRGTWFNDAAIAALIDRELASSERYRGIGEFHVHGASDASGAVMKHIVEKAVERDLWLHAHCDDAALEAIFSHDPRVKVIWAHTGFTTPPAKIAAYLAAHPTLMAELSYRDDVASGSKVTPAWRELLLRHPERFLLGSDTWNDERWAGYERRIEAYRAWLADLPAEVARNVGWQNGARMFGLPQVK